MEEFTFISPSEARSRAANSIATAQMWLKGIENKIVEAADGGKNYIEIHLDAFDTTFGNIPPVPPVHIQKAIQLLKDMGYVVKYQGLGDLYVPRGLANDDGTGPMHRNYGLVIGW